jgi:hypothetical protein
MVLQGSIPTPFSGFVKQTSRATCAGIEAKNGVLMFLLDLQERFDIIFVLFEIADRDIICKDPFFLFPPRNETANLNNKREFDVLRKMQSPYRRIW